MADISRRALLLSSGGACLSVGVNKLRSVTTADLEMCSLMQRFDGLARQIDTEVRGEARIPWMIYEAFDQVIAQIEQKRTDTLFGLSVKARIATWALMGETDLVPEATLDVRMGRSIIRDLTGGKNVHSA